MIAWIMGTGSKGILAYSHEEATTIQIPSGPLPLMALAHPPERQVRRGPKLRSGLCIEYSASSGAIRLGHLKSKMWL